MRVIVIGGNAAGATAAARLRRLRDDVEIVIIERSEAISFANCGLSYYISGTIGDRSRLFVDDAASLAKKYRLDIQVNHEATAIDPAAHTVTVADLRSGRAFAERYDKLIIATGATPVRPAIAGLAESGVLFLWSVADADRIAQRIGAGAQSALILGAGQIGCLLAEALRTRGLDVAIVESGDGVLAPLDGDIASAARGELEAHGVSLTFGDSVSLFERTSSGGVRATLRGSRALTADIAAVSIGIAPDSRLAATAGLSTGATGGIVVGPDLRTSNPDIYAVGDAIECMDFSTSHPRTMALAGPAQLQGRIAAENIAGREPGWSVRYEGIQGSTIVKLWDTSLGMTGATTALLARTGSPFRSVTVDVSSHAEYMPGACDIRLKLLFGVDGTVLGAQAAGKEGVDKRLDVIATAMRFNATVSDLEGLELCYSPQHGTPRDAVNIAASKARAMLDEERLRKS